MRGWWGLEQQHITSAVAILITASQGTFFTPKNSLVGKLMSILPWLQTALIFFLTSPRLKQWKESRTVWRKKRLLYMTQIFNFPSLYGKMPRAMFLYRFSRWICWAASVRGSQTTLLSIMNMAQSWSCLRQECNALFTSRRLIKAGLRIC